MKKIIASLILFLASAGAVFADNSITIPADFLLEVARAAEFKVETNFIQRLLINQLINNTTVKGVHLKDLKSVDLIEIFTENGVFKKVSDTKLIEPNTGATLLFDSKEDCKKNSCTIIVDLNGDKMPNELWLDYNYPKDQIKFVVNKDKEGNLTIELPECLK